MTGKPCEGSECNKFILSLDVGTTSLKCFVFNNNATVVGSSTSKIELIVNKQQGWFELDEDLIFKQSVQTIKDALSNAKLSSDKIDCLGITTQRNTFITWDRDTGIPFHHLNSWQDLRACKYVNEWNNCLKLKLFNGFFKFLHLITRHKRFLAASKLKFKSAQVVLRLKWMLDNNEQLKAKAAAGKVLFGTLDTWLLWKLSGEKMHATDYSNASSTALFDPFEMSWSTVVCGLVGIPMNILPPILDTSGYFGCIDQKFFGAKIPIRALVADQQSSMFGQCLFQRGDMKCTMGTGTFIDCNTGDNPHTSMRGLYPLVGWKIGSECAYIAEGFASNTGQSLEWAKSVGLVSSYEEFEEMALKSLAAQTKPSDLCFVPAFNGFQAPVNDDEATALMIGMTLSTTKEDIVRSILNSIAFRFYLLESCITKEMKGKKLSTIIMCDGGVSSSLYLLRIMSHLSGRFIIRAQQINSTATGAAYLAGLASGIWKNKEELTNYHEKFEGHTRDFKRGSVRFFRENAITSSKLEFELDDKIVKEYEKWLEAIGRCRQWRSC